MHMNDGVFDCGAVAIEHIDHTVLLTRHRGMTVDRQVMTECRVPAKQLIYLVDDDT